MPRPQGRGNLAYNRDYTFFTISEVARYFGRSPDWIRRKEADGKFRNRDGTLLEPLRSVVPGYKVHGGRRYYMADVWNMAKSAYQQGAISKEHSDAILEVLSAIKRVNKIIEKKRVKRNDS